MTDLETIIKDMEARLSPKRIAHTASTTQTALKIRGELSLDAKLDSKLEIAGWLHDCCKELKTVEMLLLAKFYKIEIFEPDKLQPNLLHARVGACWVEDEYEIYDPDITLAIKDHTLGSPNMSVNAKILFLADMIEPLRDKKEKEANPHLQNQLDEIRNILFIEKNLDLALLKAMNAKIIDTINKSQSIHPLGIEARNTLLASLSKHHLN